MIVVVREWYGARSARERRLLLVMLALLAPLVAWLLVVAPLSRAYDDALERHLEAVDRNGRVQALARLPNSPSPAAAGIGTDLHLVISDSANQAGLTVASNNPAGANAAAVVIGPVSPTAVAQWLSGLEQRGIRVEEFRMTPADAGTVNLVARLARGAR